MSYYQIPIIKKRYSYLLSEEEAVYKVRGGEYSKYHIPSGKSIMKLANDTESLKHQKIPLDLAKLISQTRVGKGLSQKDLATKICEKVQIINDYEAGRAIPNNAILTKIERALAVKLRGKERGQPLKSNKK